MGFHTQIYDNFLAKWRARRQLTDVERLEREYLEAQSLGHEFQASKQGLQDIKSKAEQDMLHSDESANDFSD